MLNTLHLSVVHAGGWPAKSGNPAGLGWKVRATDRKHRLEHTHKTLFKTRSLAWRFLERLRAHLEDEGDLLLARWDTERLFDPRTTFHTELDEGSISRWYRRHSRDLPNESVPDDALEHTVSASDDALLFFAAQQALDEHYRENHPCQDPFTTPA